jgi:hypothetical protein
MGPRSKPNALTAEEAKRRELEQNSEDKMAGLKMSGSVWFKLERAASLLILLTLISASARAATHARTPCSPGPAPCVDMYVVAHQDDDLLFMNPDIQNSIASGNHVVTVYTTNGCLACDDSPADVQYWIGRASGEINAYTYMIDPANASSSASHLPIGWSYASIAVANTQVATYTYKRNGAMVTLVFLQIPDIAAVDETIKWLWETAGASDATLSCLNLCPYGVKALPVVSYTRQRLVDVLAGLMSYYKTDSVSTTDGTNLYTTGFNGPGDGDAPENPSHFFSGLFTTVAAAQSEATDTGAPRVVRLYRGYTIVNEPENLSDEEAFPKLLSFARYALYDPDVTFCSDSTLASPHFCDGNGNTYTPYQTDYQYRKYVTRQLQGARSLSGRLMTADGGCLRKSAGTLTKGSCTGATSWTLSARSQMKSGSSCLDVAEGNGVDEVTLDTCRSPVSSGQTLRLFGNGQIRTFDGNCLNAVGNTVNAAPCTGQTQPLFSHACTDPPTLQVPCPLGIAVPSQNWTLIFDPTLLLSTQFSDATEIPTLASYYRTFGIAGSQICVRRASGVMCAPYVHTKGGPTLGPGTYLPDAFPDSEGWAADADGSTVRAFAEGTSAIACGRGYYGVGCTSGLGTSDYSDAQGWASGVWYYDSIRYVDVDGDSHHDVCGRGYYGISCSLAGTGSFGVASLWEPAYTAADGWNASPYGESIQFGDIDGDGRADVCGRGIYGMECSDNALPAAAAFNRQHNWSADSDRLFPRTISGPTVKWEFSAIDPLVKWSSQPYYYRSVQLVDINHDGFADVCGRGPGGIYCALSTGTGFEPRRNVLPFDFTDALGWNVDDKGSTISFGDLDGSSRTWICGRGYFGVVCAKGY